MTDLRRTDRVLVYQDATKEWRWRRRAANGETISDSAESYQNRHHALTMAAEVNPGIAIQLEGEEEF